MSRTLCMRRSVRGALAVSALAAALASTGCQHEYNGQTLPSAYFMFDDVQYYNPGPEFKLSREAAAMQAYADEVGGVGPAGPPPLGPAVPAGPGGPPAPAVPGVPPGPGVAPGPGIP